VKRWNGWGEESISYPLPQTADLLLEDKLGPGNPVPDAQLGEVLARVPPSRLPSHHLVKPDPEERLRHALGQSLPDWIALRSGRIARFPDGVAYPTSDAQVRDLLDYAQANGIFLIPYGGGTSVVGHINPPPGDIPSLTLDLTRLNRLLEVDETSRLATFEAGVCGPDLERQLGNRGLTLGHYPQSFEFSTLGGWFATRSCGQQSHHYGRIEDLFAGGHVEAPAGPVDLLPYPASASGPDLRQAFLGSEGRFGILTRAVLRVRPLPQMDVFFGIFFHDFERGYKAVRAMAQEDLPLSMLRLSDSLETEVTLALSGKGRMAAWASRGLAWLGYTARRCLSLFGATGNARTVRTARNQAYEVARDFGGLPVGSLVGEIWRKSRFRTPYLRNALWERGYALDTLESAFPWRSVLPALNATKQAILNTCTAGGEKALVFAHLSHVYRDGASLYLTYLFRRATDPQDTLRQWLAMKTAASQAILAHGGTISHQHGIGRDHAAYVEQEKGRLGKEILEAICETCDPQGILNPGVLVADVRTVTR
jgi:alkyldihydroxyacetonephosphate synthase